MFNILAKKKKIKGSLENHRSFEEDRERDQPEYESDEHWQERNKTNILQLSIKSYHTPLCNILIIHSNQQLHLFECFHKFLLVIIICDSLNSC